MLLETLDIKQDDIVIYSQNLFSNEKNFKIVYKDDADKISHNISYIEVCRYINEYTPKNIIIYRLLTNIIGFEIYATKYGFQVHINGAKELIFFDPVYAVRELEEYSESIDYNNLRFRIQQVGLTTLNRKGNVPNFAEIYSIDLEATEAKFQNDKVFADAIISSIKTSKTGNEDKKIENKATVKTQPVEIKKTADINKSHKQFDKIDFEEKSRISIEPDNKPASPGHSDNKKFNELWKEENTKSPKQHSVVKITEEFMSLKKPVLSDNNVGPSADKPVEVEKDKPKKNISVEQNVQGIKIFRHDISEDKNFNYKELMKINSKKTSVFDDKKLNSTQVQYKPYDKPEKEIKHTASRQNKTEKKEPGLFGKYLKEVKNNKDEKKADQHGDEKVSQVLNMFKTSSSANEYVQVRANKQIVLKLDNK
jgi:hypothetical protein